MCSALFFIITLLMKFEIGVFLAAIFFRMSQHFFCKVYLKLSVPPKATFDFFQNIYYISNSK